VPHPHASAKRPRTWLPLALLALAYLLVLARMASDRYTNAAGAAAALLL
jgi:hypothetical protein